MKREDKLKNFKASLIMSIYTKSIIKEQPYKTVEEYIEEISKYFNVNKTESGWIISSDSYEALLELNEILFYIENADIRKNIKPVKPEYRKLSDI